MELVRFLKTDYLDRIVWGPYDVEMETVHIIENLTDQLSEIYWDMINFLNGIRPDIDLRQTFLNGHFQCGTVKPVEKLSYNAKHDDRILLSKVCPIPFFVFWGLSLNFWLMDQAPRARRYSNQMRDFAYAFLAISPKSFARASNVFPVPSDTTVLERARRPRQFTLKRLLVRNGRYSYRNIYKITALAKEFLLGRWSRRVLPLMRLQSVRLLSGSFMHRVMSHSCLSIIGSKIA
jgi:hypothetical protein